MKTKHIIRFFVLFSAVPLLLAGFSLAQANRSAQAAPRLQAPIYTPTPGPDGKIIWVVRPNDTLLSISLITGVPVEQIRTLNNLSGDMITVGQKLVIGLAGPAEVTPTFGPTPTPTPVLPTPSPRPGVGKLCIILFDDQNGDSIRQEEEASIPGGAISVNDRSGSIALTADTDASLEHKCFVDLPEGNYTITVAVPQGFNSTTTSTYATLLRAGDETYVDFGAQANSQTLAENSILPAEGRKSPLLGIVGALFLLLGGTLAFFASRLMRGR
jgi:hypothetical protein